MKNRDKDALYKSNRCTLSDFFFIVRGRTKKKPLQQGRGQYYLYNSYFTWYITSLTSFTVRGTSGNAAATRLGA
jgi:hypothetical protein